MTYVKYQSDTSKFRNFITVHRNDDSYTSQYKMLEDTFISIGKGEGNGKMKETIFKMDTVQKNLLKNFLESRSQGLMFNKSNVDPKTGKPTIYDPIDGRPGDLSLIAA